jgi:HK97 family phage prohead protease
MHSKWQWQLRAIVGDSFARNYEIDVLAVSEGQQTGEGNEKEQEISPQDPGNPQSAITDPNGVPMIQQNSVDNKWIKAANLIVRKLEPVLQVPVEGRAKNFETRINPNRVELREVKGGNGMTFEGYAAVFNSPSDPIGGQFTEYVMPGAFKRSLESRNDVKLLWNHDAGEVLGSTRSGTLRLMEDAYGLKATAELPNTQRGRDTAELIRRGDIASMSFGFSVPKGGDSWSDGGSVRHLNSVRLFETSIVAFPAYQASSASVRSASIDADVLADSLMKLENGEELDAGQAAIITDVVAKLTKSSDLSEAKADLDLKKKQLDLMMKRI